MPCGRVTLLPGNNEAWSAWQRVSDQFGSYPVGEGEDTRLHYYIRAEALAAVITLMDCKDPTETYDRVMMIHNARNKN